MPSRRRGREAARAAARAAKRPDLAAWQVPLVGQAVQTEATWADREQQQAEAQRDAREAEAEGRAAWEEWREGLRS